MAVEKSGIAKDVTEVSFSSLITFSMYFLKCCSPVLVFVTSIHTDVCCFI